MYATGWVVACILTFLGFAVSKPWKSDPYDPKVSQYIHGVDVAMQYDVLDAVTFGDVFMTTDPQYDYNARLVASWDRVAPGEASFTAVLFDYADEYKDLGAYASSDILPSNNYCGAVFITSDTILTLCACVVTFFASKFHFPGKTESSFRYDKLVDMGKDSIYVWHGANYFKPWLHDWRVKLSESENTQILDNKWCIDISTDSEDHFFLQRATPVVLKVDLPWHYFAETRVPWPPTVFSYNRDKAGYLEVGAPLTYRRYVKAYHFNHRMQNADYYKGLFYSEFGEELDLGFLVISWNKTFTDQIKCSIKEPCLRKGYCPKIEKFKKLLEGITCFESEPKPYICGGVIGSPVYGADFGIHGLATHKYPCGTQTGPELLRGALSSAMSVMALTPRVAEYIETLVPDLIDSSKELPEEHLFRDREDYKSYDMVKYKFEVVDEPHSWSKASTVEPLWILSALIFVSLSIVLLH